MFSNIVGTMIGMGAYNWLFGDDEKEQPQVPAVAPVPTPSPASNPLVAPTAAVQSN
ncbi:hypothetical protein [Ensifer sp. MJa1]|uniref:hypothetical protein n=1 Tax=Ensifer sp. MJa1 TaxID=2919888 RepID=UPI003008398A